MKIFIDMDGTIARFYEADDCLEKMYEPGFFKDLKPYKKAIKLIDKLHDKGYNIYILSACIETASCRLEKNIWLNKYLPYITDDHRLFIPCDISKANYVKFMGYEDERVNILIDDYSKNLIDWDDAFGKHGIAIKAINEINNKKNTYKKCIKVN